MLPCSIVDAFAAEGGAFTGNPAAVVVLGAAAPGAWAPRSPCEGAHWPEDAYLLAVAKEFNLSETAYVAALPAADGADAAALPRFGLRWFTPAAEVALCGHATLAAAHALFERGAVPSGACAIAFDTLHSGELVVEREEAASDGAGGARYTMDFPADPPGGDMRAAAGEGAVAGEACLSPTNVAAALGVKDAQVRTVARGRFDYLVELETPSAVAAVEPNLGAVCRGMLANADAANADPAHPYPARGVIVASAGGGDGEYAGVDFVSRAFFPNFNIDEDPVCGSAHCMLSPYFWSAARKPLAADGGGGNGGEAPTPLRAHQLSARGGVVDCVVTAGGRVRLSGAAVTTMRGEVVGPKN